MRSRGRDDAPPSRLETAALLATAGLLGVAGYLGGDLVYRNQIGVDHRYADAGQWQERRLPPADAGAAGVEIGAVDDLRAGQMRLLHIGQRRIVLARTDSRLVAFDDRCSHRGGSLADGSLACDTVQCPWHGSQFSVLDGSVQRGPADTPIAVHEVHEHDGQARLVLRD